MIDRIGMRVGLLTVVERTSKSPSGRSRFIAKCDCGGERVVHGNDLHSGRSTNCGCVSRKNVSKAHVKIIPTGTRFGSLTVIRRGPNVKKFAGWFCMCDCGNMALISGPGLRSGNNKSCGCNYGNMNLEAAKFRALETYKRSAKGRGLEWGLTDDEFFLIVAEPCHYCGEIPSNLASGPGKRAFKIGGRFYYSGIDRVNNDEGYTPSNCVPSCKWCNKAKLDRDYEEFIAWINRAHFHISAAIARHTP